MTGLQQVQRILARYQDPGHECRQHVSTCANCGIWLQEAVTGSRDTAKGPMCSDCYFEEWGAVVEQDPISSPHRR
jgi:hypothetical protein